jgi:Flp pilus assembly pilin Flp
MLGRLRNRKAQSTAEYAVLIGLVVAVVITMQTYVKRGWQARVKAESDTMFNVATNGALWGGIGIAPTPTSVKSQYEPTLVARSSTENVTTDKDTLSMQEGGKVTRSFERGSSQGKGDYQLYDPGEDAGK